jgi:transcriptional regulator with XRE-family HTH domain
MSTFESIRVSVFPPAPDVLRRRATERVVGATRVLEGLDIDELDPNMLRAASTHLIRAAADLEALDLSESLQALNDPPDLPELPDGMLPGALVRALRLALRATVIELADASGISPGSVKSFERDRLPHGQRITILLAEGLANLDPATRVDADELADRLQRGLVAAGGLSVRSEQSEQWTPSWLNARRQRRPPAEVMQRRVRLRLAYEALGYASSVASRGAR